MTVLYKPFGDLGNEMVEAQVNEILGRAYIYMQPRDHGKKIARTYSGAADIIADVDEDGDILALEVMWR